MSHDYMPAPTRTKRMDAHKADLLLLTDPDFERSVKVHCRACSGNINYLADFSDPLTGRFFCDGFTSNWYGTNYCKNTQELRHVKESMAFAIAQLYYIEIPYPNDRVFKLETEYHVGKIAYNYLREATEEECWEAAEADHQRLRDRIR